MRAQLEQATVGELFVCAYVGAKGSWISPSAGLLDSVLAQAIADDSQLEGGGVGRRLLKRRRRMRRDLEKESGGGEKRA